MATLQVKTQTPDRDELARLVPAGSFRLVKFFENLASDVSTTIPEAIGESIQGPGTSVGDRDVVIFDGTGGNTVKDSGVSIDVLAHLDSPAFTGSPTAPTPPVLDSSTRLATTAFVNTATTNAVQGPGASVNNNIALFNGTDGKAIKDSGVALASLAPISSPAFTGTPTAPNQVLGDNDTSIANTAFVQAALADVAAKGAYFSAHNNGFAQFVPTGPFLTLALGLAPINVGGYYNIVANTWTPPAGRVIQLMGAVTINTTAGALVTIAVFKNGVIFKRGVMTLGSGANANTVTVQCIDVPNGTDVYDLRVSQTTGVAQNTYGAAESTYFQGMTIQA